MDEMLEWIKENYPSVIGNMELMQMLYKTKVLGETLAEIFPMKITPINEIILGEYVQIRFVKVQNFPINQIKLCVSCFKKECNCGVAKEEYYSYSAIGGDNSGTIVVSLLNKHTVPPVLLSNDYFLIRGKTHFNDYNKRVTLKLKQYMTISKVQMGILDKFDNLFSIHANPMGEISTTDFNEFVKQHSIDMTLIESLQPYIKLNFAGDKVSWVN